METKPSLNRIEADRENKNNKKEAVAKLSCGVSKVLYKAGESRMFIDVEIQGNIFEFLVDTGVTITLISRKVAQNHLVVEGSLEPLKSDILIADGTTLKIYGMQALKFSIHNRQFQHKMVVADLTVDGILCLDFLKSNDCTLNIANCSLILTNQSHIFHAFTKVR